MPGAKCEFIPVGRAVRATFGRHAPVGLSIAQPAAGVVTGIDRGFSKTFDQVRAVGGVDGDFIFRPAEFFDLKGMRGGGVGWTIGRAGCDGKFHSGIAHIDGFGNIARQRKPAIGIDGCGPFGKFIALRIKKRIGHGFTDAGRRANIAIFGGSKPPNPAFDIDGFAGFVEFSIIKHKPAQAICRGVAMPVAILLPPAIGFRQDGGVNTFANQQEIRFLGRFRLERQSGQSIGPSFGSQVFRKQHDFSVFDRFSIRERIGPGNQVGVIHQRINRQPG